MAQGRSTHFDDEVDSDQWVVNKDRSLSLYRATDAASDDGTARAKCRVQGAGCRVQGAGCRVQGQGQKMDISTEFADWAETELNQVN